MVKTRKALIATVVTAGMILGTLSGAAFADSGIDELSEVTDSEVEFVDADFSDGYFEAIPVPESIGDEQQIEAVVAGQESESSGFVARVDLDSDNTVIGAIWDAEGNAPVNVNLRYLSDGVWSPWQELEIAEPTGSLEGSTRVGTEPFSLTNAQAVEAAALSDEGEYIPGLKLVVLDVEGGESVANALEEISVDDAQSQSESDAGLDFVEPESADEEDLASVEQDAPIGDSGEATSDERLGTDEPIDLGEKAAFESDAASYDSRTPSTFSTGLNANQTVYDTGFSGLKITTRKGWGANEGLREGYQDETVKYQGAVVHHTEGSNNYTQSQVPGQIQGIYYYHAVTLGWGDVGYQLLVDKFGGVWEGRYGTLSRSVMGAHAYGANRETFGISVLGSYTNAAPPAVAQDSVAKTIAWMFKRYGITNPQGTISVPGSDQRGRRVSVVSGHRDVGATDCPGNAFYAQMGNLRNKVTAYMNGSGSGFGGFGSGVQIGNGWGVGRTIYVGDWSGSGFPGLMLIRPDGDLFYYAGLSGEKFVSPVKVGHGWQGMNWVQGGVDWNGDGRADLIARDGRGDLYLYPGDGRGGFGARVKIGNGWSSMKQMALVRYGSSSAVLAVDSGGKLFAYVGDGRGGFLAPAQIGHGWSSMTALVGVGDLDGDGVPDLLGRASDGKLYFYAGQSGGGFMARREIGHGWSRMQSIGSANQNGARSPLWVVDDNGKLLTYPVK